MACVSGMQAELWGVILTQGSDDQRGKNDRKCSLDATALS